MSDCTISHGRPCDECLLHRRERYIEAETSLQLIMLLWHWFYLENIKIYHLATFFCQSPTKPFHSIVLVFMCVHARVLLFSKLDSQMALWKWCAGNIFFMIFWHITISCITDMGCSSGHIVPNFLDIIRLLAVAKQCDPRSAFLSHFSHNSSQAATVKSGLLDDIKISCS